VVDPFVLCERYGVDAVRYQILRDMPYGSDCNFTNELMLTRINADLANDLGNLVSRTVAMVDKYFGGTLPTDRVSDELDSQLIGMAESLCATVTPLIEQAQHSKALEEIFKVISRANKYIDETAPWVLGKNEDTKPRLGTVLYNLLESIRYIAVLIQPFMPDTSKAILQQINTDISDYQSLENFGQLRVGGKTAKAEALFARIDAEKMLADIEAKVNAEQAEEKAETQKIELAPEITIDDFFKTELRVARVTACEKVKKSSKLLCLQLDDGMGGRQVVSGIAKWYKPEDLIGRKVMIVANLKPVKLCGVESNGMICCADMPDGSAKVMFADDSIPEGSKVR
ncbi:MAG TPA: methionine--tRNA ligase subunit beta, partial [Ruminococcus sp.]|nr:methionine--tRNA ligase subunit beta [Ruminococcus sp.]